MALEKRVKLYEQIEQIRGNPLIVFVTSQRRGAIGSMAGDAIDQLIDQIENIDKRNKVIDFLIESLGGDALVSWRIISLLRTNFEKINAIVPHSAFSAATLLVLGANEIIMGQNGSLGPTDPQITIRKKDGTTQLFSYEDVVSFLKFVKEEGGITEQEYLKGTLEKLCEAIEPPALGFAKRSSSLSISIGEKMLQMHMTDPETKEQASAIALKLNKSFFSHGHALSRKEAKEIGLNIKNPDEKVEKLMWDVHKDFEKELKSRKPFDPLSEFLKDPNAQPFLQSPPPLNIPPQIDQRAAIQILQDYFNRQLNVDLPDIEIELKYAFIESCRIASEFYTKNKILVQRNLDMQFNGNLINLDGGWRKVDVKNNKKNDGAKNN